jgi:HK97 family phage prohead protease
MNQLTKDHNSEIKELDDKKGYVEAIANAYNNEDSDGDISHPGSFMKTVSEGRKKLRVYKNHDTRLLIGVPKELRPEHPDGLFTGTQFNMETDLGKDMFNDIKLIHSNGQEADLSIGYQVVRRDKSNSKIITEYNLREYSFLTSWGANPNAVVLGAKSSASDIIDHLTKMYNLPYSDSRLMEVEKILKSLTTAPLESTQKDEPIDAKQLLTHIQNSFRYGN